MITDSTVESALPVNTTAMMQGLNEAKAQFEYDYLQKVLALCQGNVAQAAVVAKRNRSDFYKLLKKHNIAPS
ncbi:hypothetical protein [Pseudoalteromonas xiamenensis]